jgi:hypothetical protein
MKKRTFSGIGHDFRPGLFFFMAALPLLIQGCPEWPFEPGRSVVYSVSFETLADTTGWTGLSPDMFVEDPAPGQGSRSLRIGGGCVQPTAFLELAPVLEGDYCLEFWGRVNETSQSGTVILRRTDESNEGIGAFVRENQWTFVRNQNPLHVPAGSRIRIEILVGGYVPASMNIDGLAVVKVH